jgi:choice-of-anchor B domain-containing protein
LKTFFPTLGAALCLAFFSATLSTASAQSPCVGGLAGGYPCNEIDLMAHMPPSEIGGGEMSDIWGWTDPLDGGEYAIIGRYAGTSFIDITDPVNPVYLGQLPTHTSSSVWRDIKVFNNYAFIVSEAGGHGMQVFDLTRLRNVAAAPETFTEDGHFAGFGAAHNLVINESTGHAFAVGANTFSGGLHIVDINNPTNPTTIGSFAEDGYTHDAQVVTYTGPDAQHAGKEIAFACNESTVTIVDVTDPTDAVQLSSTGYSGSAYTHQGWLTEDHKYFLSNDELDEYYFGGNTKTHIWDVQNLDAPVHIGTYTGTNGAIDHNLYTHNGYCYQSNYRAGLRILDLENIASASLTEVAYFDVYPTSNSAAFNGTWSNYPYFASGNVIVSHIENGLYILKPTLAPPPPPCPTDLNGDGMMTVVDVLMMLGDFGCVSNCAGDVNDDGMTTVTDMLALLGEFGFNCPE